MSERFVEAFLLSPSKLVELVGTPAVGLAAVKKAVKRPLFDELARSEGGLEKVEVGLTALAAGKAPPSREYSRLATLLLHAVGEPLRPTIMEANYLEASFLPRDDFGLWNPAFRALGMPTIAKQWAKQTFMYPLGKRVAKVGVRWPLTTLVEPASLRTWKRELASAWRARLMKLDSDGSDTHFSSDALARGIEVLEQWVTRALKPTKERAAVARSGNALVLVLDGDQ